MRVSAGTGVSETTLKRAPPSQLHKRLEMLCSQKEPRVRIPNSPPKIHHHSIQRPWIFLFVRLRRGFLFKMSRTGSYPHYYCVEWWYLPFLPEIFRNRWASPPSLRHQARRVRPPWLYLSFDAASILTNFRF